MKKLCCALVCLFVLQGCVKQPKAKLRPEAAQLWLKLRGYEFNEKSFHTAGSAGDTLALSAFLDAGIDINSRSESYGTTVLSDAAGRGDLKVLNMMLERGADINVKNNVGFSALISAMYARNVEVEKILLSQPALDPNTRGFNGSTALANYASSNRKEVVQRLMELGADVNAQDYDGDAPLHIATKNRDIEILDMLLDKGANPNAKNTHGGTPLMYAAVYGNEKAVSHLLERGADASLKDADGNTALDWAIKNFNFNVAPLLQGSK